MLMLVGDSAASFSLQPQLLHGISLLSMDYGGTVWKYCMRWQPGVIMLIISPVISAVSVGIGVGYAVFRLEVGQCVGDGEGGEGFVEII